MRYNSSIDSSYDNPMKGDRILTTQVIFSKFSMKLRHLNKVTFKSIQASCSLLSDKVYHQF